VVAAKHVVVVVARAPSTSARTPLVRVGLALARMLKRKLLTATCNLALRTVLDRGLLGVVVALHVVVVRAHALSLFPHLLLMVVKRVVPPMVKRNSLHATRKPAPPTVLDRGQLGVAVVRHVVVV